MRKVHILASLICAAALGLIMPAAVRAGIIGDPGPDNGWSSIGGAAVGNPSLANGWNTTSAVSIRAASSEKPARPWSQTINGSGLDGATGLLHDTSHTTLGVSDVGNFPNTVRGGTVAGYVWVEYDLGAAYDLGEMWIWNYNEENYPHFGMYEVTIEYSTTGSTTPADWTTVFDGSIPLAAGAGLSPSGVDRVVDFDAASAQYVVITTDNPPFHNYKPADYDDTGLCEVRFNLPAAVTATASSSHATRPAINTINGSGIDPCDLGVGDDHDNDQNNMWLSGSTAASAANPNNGTVAGSHWIRFDFDQVYDLDKMWLWNYNEFNWPWFGVNEVTVEYSALADPNEPADWQTIYTGGIPMTGGGGLNRTFVDASVDFDGAAAQHVVITTVAGLTRNWSFDDPCTLPLEEVGLSEVRFFIQPASCAEARASGYQTPGDLNDDCYVNLLDFALISEDWQQCMDPQDPACQQPW